MRKDHLSACLSPLKGEWAKTLHTAVFWHSDFTLRHHFIIFKEDVWGGGGGRGIRVWVYTQDYIMEKEVIGVTIGLVSISLQVTAQWSVPCLDLIEHLMKFEESHQSSQASSFGFQGWQQQTFQQKINTLCIFVDQHHIHLVQAACVDITKGLYTGLRHWERLHTALGHRYI